MLRRMSIMTIVLAIIVFACEATFAALAMANNQKATYWIIAGFSYFVGAVWALPLLWAHIKYSDSDTYGITAVGALLVPFTCIVSVYFSYKFIKE